jgi:hypothetical protein
MDEKQMKPVSRINSKKFAVATHLPSWSHGYRYSKSEVWCCLSGHPSRYADQQFMIGDKHSGPMERN